MRSITALIVASTMRPSGRLTFTCSPTLNCRGVGLGIFGTARLYDKVLGRRVACEIRYNPAMKSRRIRVEQPSLFEMDRPEEVRPEIDRPLDHPQLLIGTSAFTAAGWPGSFYPVGMKPAQYLTHYASKFKTVEIDSTYYGSPSPSTVASWRDRTPPDFVFAAKVPQIITHEKALVNCDAEWQEFIETMSVLGDKLGPLVFQFPHFDRFRFAKQENFLAVLRPFLRKFPTGYKFAIEIRNKAWLNAALADLLREHSVALVLQDLSYMPRPWELKDKFDPVTAEFTYVRWLGDRKGIEKLTMTWDKIIVDRRDDLLKWAELFRQFISKGVKVYTYANNHYAGNGPGTVTLFRALLKPGLGCAL